MQIIAIYIYILSYIYSYDLNLHLYNLLYNLLRSFIQYTISITDITYIPRISCTYYFYLFMELHMIDMLELQ